MASFLVDEEQSARIGRMPGSWRGDAVDNFNEDLNEMAGRELPVLEIEPQESNVIRFMLESRRAEDMDRFSITFPEERTMLITGSEVSARWALNYILENFAGIRYLGMARDATHFPEIDELKIPRESIEVSPSFNLTRRVGWRGMTLWGKRINYTGDRVPMGHVLLRYVFPSEKYEEEGWPEFIFPVIDGRRRVPSGEVGRVGWQQCLTDQRVVDEAVKNIIEFFIIIPNILPWGSV